MEQAAEYPPVGVPEIDRDHLDLSACLRRLLDAVKDDDRVRALALAEALVERARAHFALEEQLMREIAFVFSARHQRTHDRFLEEAERHLEELRAFGLNSRCLRWTAETMEWFRSHVLTEDMALGRALISSMRVG